jgi:hypothetical protein
VAFYATFQGGHPDLVGLIAAHHSRSAYALP